MCRCCFLVSFFKAAFVFLPLTDSINFLLGYEIFFLLPSAPFFFFFSCFFVDDQLTIWQRQLVSQQRNVNVWVEPCNCRLQFTRLVFPLLVEFISQLLLSSCLFLPYWCQTSGTRLVSCTMSCCNGCFKSLFDVAAEKVFVAKLFKIVKPRFCRLFLKNVQQRFSCLCLLSRASESALSTEFIQLFFMQRQLYSFTG